MNAAAMTATAPGPGHVVLHETAHMVPDLPKAWQGRWQAPSLRPDEDV